MNYYTAVIFQSQEISLEVLTLGRGPVDLGNAL